MIRRPPRSTQSRSSAASDVYKRQPNLCINRWPRPSRAKKTSIPTPSKAQTKSSEVTNNSKKIDKNPNFPFPSFHFPSLDSLIGLSAGDCVLMRPSDSDKPPYVARAEKIEADHRNNVKVRVRWYYRPEESMGGRRQFHGAKELFLSDHYDVQSAHTIEGKCVVHSFKNYTKLENVGAEDYFCRFEYKAATGGFTPDRVAV